MKQVDQRLVACGTEPESAHEAGRPEKIVSNAEPGENRHHPESRSSSGTGFLQRSHPFHPLVPKLHANTSLNKVSHMSLCLALCSLSKCAKSNPMLFHCTSMLLCIGENLGLSSNGGNTDNGSNTGNGGNGGNAGNGGNYGGVTGALPEGGNAVQAGDSKVLSGSVTGVTGVTTSGKPVYNPSDGESRQGNLEPFFPGGLKTGISLPRGGPSIEDLASRAGVSVEAVQEELDRWKKCGRLKEGDDGTIHLLAGTSYPGQDEPEPKEEDEPPVSAPKGPPKLPAAPPERRHVGMRDVTFSDAGKKVLPGQAALQFDEEPTPPTMPPGRNPLLEIAEEFDNED